ncbi:MAG: SlyX family protein [Deltaproteobacteria bacterium]|nr:SlyX family protein [Deltaproteobacteria bacterium]
MRAPHEPSDESDDSTAARLVEVEVKLAFHQQTIADLSQALVEKERRITALERQVEHLEKAMRVLAQRAGTSPGEVLGAHPEDDPVPRSG